MAAFLVRLLLYCCFDHRIVHVLFGVNHFLSFSTSLRTLILLESRLFLFCHLNITSTVVIVNKAASNNPQRGCYQVKHTIFSSRRRHKS